jgi:hypothetical protein
MDADDRRSDPKGSVVDTRRNIDDNHAGPPRARSNCYRRGLDLLRST